MTGKPSDSFREIAAFDWDEQRCQAAICLAEGKTHKETAEEVESSDRTIRNWLQHPDFAAEVDRLSLMVDIASRAGRMRIAMKAIRQFIKENKIETNRDVLEWLKFAQSETDGVKLDLGKLAAFAQNETPVADSRSGGTFGGSESEAAN